MCDEQPKHRWLYVSITLVLVALLFGIYKRYRAEALVRKARDLQQAMRNLPPEQRGAKMQELRETMAAIPVPQRERMREDGRKRFEQEMIAYTKLAPAERAKRLDEQINAMERLRQQAPANPNFGSGQRPQRPATANQDERDRRRKQRLDGSTPEFRSAMDQFRKDLENRRRERGLPPQGGRR